MIRDSGHREALEDSIGAEDVKTYLRDHPDFLIRHPDLLNYLTLPPVDRGGGVVDLQHFQIQRLRSDIASLKVQQQELINTSRANANNQSRVHAAVLFLMDARSFEQLIHVVTTDLAVLLDLDAVTLVVESNGLTDIPHVHRSGVRVVEPGTVRTWLGRRDVALSSDVTPDRVLWGPATGLVRSQALARLRVSCDTPDGLVAFGSREPDMFHTGQGTELVGFLAKVIERSIRAWLDLPA